MATCQKINLEMASCHKQTVMASCRKQQTIFKNGFMPKQQTILKWLRAQRNKLEMASCRKQKLMASCLKEINQLLHKIKNGRELKHITWETQMHRLKTRFTDSNSRCTDSNYLGKQSRPDSRKNHHRGREIPTFQSAPQNHEREIPGLLKMPLSLSTPLSRTTLIWNKLCTDLLMKILS